MITILCVGKIKENYLNEMISDYKKRISKYEKIEIIEVKDNNDINKETEELQKHINPRSFIITLEIEGQKYSSEQFADIIDKTHLTHSHITFVIGSSNGLSEQIKKQANLALSFSSFTFPHGLFRGILLEQIYRANKINNNEVYHK